MKIFFTSFIYACCILVKATYYSCVVCGLVWGTKYGVLFEKGSSQREMTGTDVDPIPFILFDSLDWLSVKINSLSIETRNALTYQITQALVHP